MIDLVLYAPTGKSDIVNFARSNPPNNPLLDEDNNARQGVSYCWWGNDGDFMTSPAVVDGEGNVTTPATFAPGKVMLLRISPEFFDDRLVPDDADPDKEEQWARSKIARYVKNNGTPGTMAGGTIPYYEIDGVRLLRPSDVKSFIAANNTVGHEWVGGNNF